MKRDLSQDLLLSVLSHLNLHDIVSVICSCKTFDSTDYLRMKHDAMKDIAIKVCSLLIACRGGPPFWSIFPYGMGGIRQAF